MTTGELRARFRKEKGIKRGPMCDVQVKYIYWLESQAKELIEENKKKDIQLTNAMNTLSILRKDADEADHADYCMCRHCSPEFHKLKTNKNERP